MAFLSIMQKTVSLSPTFVVSTALRGIVSTRSFSKSADKVKLKPRRLFDGSEHEDFDEIKDYRKLRSNESNPKLVYSDNHQDGTEHINGKIDLGILKRNISSNVYPSFVNLGHFPFEVQRSADGRILNLTRNHNLHEVVNVMVQASSLESKEHEPVPLTVSVTKEIIGVKTVKYVNLFKLTLMSQQYIVDSMSIQKLYEPSPDISPDVNSKDCSDCDKDCSDYDKDFSDYDSSDDNFRHMYDHDSPDETLTKNVDKKNLELEEFVGPDYNKLEECWRLALHNYLIERGLKPAMIKSLREYVADMNTTLWKTKFLDIFLQ